MSTDDRGQSESIGSILLVAIAVLTVSVVGAFALAQVGQGGGPTAEIKSNISATQLSLTHAGGDSLPGDELRVIVRWDGNEEQYDFTSTGEYDTDNGGLFEPGETWSLDNPPYDPNDRVTVYLIHDPSGTVLFRGSRIAGTPTPTPTSAPGVRRPSDFGEPTADFTWSPKNPSTGQSVDFRELATDRDGSITSYVWEFGDNTTATGPNPSHTYNSSGSYNVTLTVTDNDGNTDLKAKTINVTGTGGGSQGGGSQGGGSQSS